MFVITFSSNEGMHGETLCPKLHKVRMYKNIKRCFVFQVISGPFCECDNFSCDYANGLLCSGSDHGTCICGKCQCKPDWTGDACDCRASSITCIPPGGGEICSGNGDCNCGACECYEGKEGRYTGKFCEKLPVSRKGGSMTNGFGFNYFRSISKSCLMVAVAIK